MPHSSSLAEPGAPRELGTLTVLGHAFFAPRFASVADALVEEHRQSMAPVFALVEGRLRRFTSLVTQMHLEVAGQALAHAGVAPRDVHPVFTSAYGETATTVTLLEGIHDAHVASAARFPQSVHNTPSGLFSIATGNQHPASVLAAGEAGFAAGMLEALALLGDGKGPVLLTAVDDRIPSVLRSHAPGEALAMALVLAADGPASAPRLAVRSGVGEQLPTDDDTLAASPQRFALRLLDHLTRLPTSATTTSDLPIEPVGRHSLSVQVRLP